MIGLQEAAALAAVLALIAASAWLARRSPALTARRGGQDAIRVRGSIALDARRRLHLIETAAGSALVLTGGGTDQILAWPRAQERDA